MQYIIKNDIRVISFYSHKNVFHTNTIEENIPNKNTSSRIIVK